MTLYFICRLLTVTASICLASVEPEGGKSREGLALRSQWSAACLWAALLALPSYRVGLLFATSYAGWLTGEHWGYRRLLPCPALHGF